MNNERAVYISPCFGKNNKTEKNIHIEVQKNKNDFLYPPWSAIAPIIGDNKAIITAQTLTALPQYTYPILEAPTI